MGYEGLEDSFGSAVYITATCKNCGKQFEDTQNGIDLKEGLCPECLNLRSLKRQAERENAEQERQRIIDSISQERVDKAIAELEKSPQWQGVFRDSDTKDWKLWVLRQNGFFKEEDPEGLLDQGDPFC